MTSRRPRKPPSSTGLGMTGFGNLLLLNALSSRIYRLLEKSSRTIIAGYEQGGLLGLLRSPAFRALLRRYLWLLSVAFAFERVRKFWSWLNVTGTASSYLYITATLKPGDQSYDWILAFWERSKAFKFRSRDFLVETGLKSGKKQKSASRMLEQPLDVAFTEDGVAKDGSALIARLSPRENAKQYIWHEGTLFRFKRCLQATPGSGSSEPGQSVISIRSYAPSRAPFFKLLASAKKVYDDAMPQMITIRVGDPYRATWKKAAYRHCRGLDTVIMDEAAKEGLMKDVKEFLVSESWYNQRGISWKRGYLLNGPPGTGKSSTIQAIASEVKLDVYILSINSPHIDDSSLQAAFRGIPPRSIVVIEDIDAVKIQKRDLPPPNLSSTAQRSIYRHCTPPTPVTTGAPPTISLSALLNCIDGVEGNDGRLLFLTTNAITALDPALTRAGRVDMLVEYKLTTRAQARQLFEIFYTPSQAAMTEGILETSKGKDSLKSQDKRVPQPFSLPEDITKEEISTWAKVWASHLPEDTFSIAELQGMLLAYKKDPQGASLAMPNWVDKEIQRKKQEEVDKERELKEQEAAEKKAEEDKKKAEEEEKKKESQLALATVKKASSIKAKEVNGKQHSVSTRQGERKAASNDLAVNGNCNEIQNGHSTAVSPSGSSALGITALSSPTVGRENIKQLLNGTSNGKGIVASLDGSRDTPDVETAAPSDILAVG